MVLCTKHLFVTWTECQNFKFEKGVMNEWPNGGMNDYTIQNRKYSKCAWFTVYICITFNLFQNIHLFPLISTALTSQLLSKILTWEVGVSGEGPATAPLAPGRLGNLGAQNTWDTIGTRRLASHHSTLCSTHETHPAFPSRGHFWHGPLLERTTVKGNAGREPCRSALCQELGSCHNVISQLTQPLAWFWFPPDLQLIKVLSCKSKLLQGYTLPMKYLP